MTKIKIKIGKLFLASLLCGGVFLFLGASIMAEEESSSGESEVIEEDKAKKVEEREGKEEEEEDPTLSRVLGTTKGTNAEEKERENEPEAGSGDSELGNGNPEEDEGAEDEKTEDNKDILKDTLLRQGSEEQADKETDKDTDKDTEDKKEKAEKKSESETENGKLEKDSTSPQSLTSDVASKGSSSVAPTSTSETDEEKGDVIINEIAWMGTENSSNDEWIELKNETDEKIVLDGWIFEAEDGSPRIELSGNISGGEYFLLERTDDTSVPKVEADQIYTGALGNGGEYLRLKDEEGKEIDEVDALTDWPAGDNGEKFTMERTGGSFWQDSCSSGGTPKEKNSDQNNCLPGSGYDYGLLVINEVLPDPIGSDKEEWIEIHNLENKEIALEGWLIKDLTKEYKFSDQVAEANGYLILKNKLSLNNSGDKLTLVDPKKEIASEAEYGKAPTGKSWARKIEGGYKWTHLITPGGKNEFPIEGQFKNKIIFNEVMSNPEGKDKNFEWVEFKNTSGENINLKSWQIENGTGSRFTLPEINIDPDELKTVIIRDTSMSIRNGNEKLKLIDVSEEKIDEVFLQGYAKSGVSYSRNGEGIWSWSRISTPDKENWINIPPQIKIKKSKKAYRDIYVYFDASKTKDDNGDKLKYRWDFGDGHYSYLKKTKHKYGKEKKYQVTLRVDDGSGQFYQSFKIKLKPYPRREVRIIRLVPNPAGADTGNEVIVLENLSSKRINLLGWYLSTGKDKENLVNHPFYDDFILEPGESKELTNEELCKFTLLNKTAMVVLRYPDLKKAFIVEYNKEKIAEDEAYALINDEWRWIGGETENSEETVQIEGESNNREELFSWLKVFEDDISQTCQCMSALTFSNWKERNKTWLQFV